jgi:hypothetical protein
MRTTETINSGVSIEADAVLGLTARIQRFGGYATDEVGLAPEPFDAATTSQDLRNRSGQSLSALGALEEVERKSPRNCRAVGSLTTGAPEGS